VHVSWLLVFAKGTEGRDRETIAIVATSACARSSPTATSASASSTVARKREQTHEHLATATTMYRDMGMAYWLEKAAAQMGEL
jgi:hypothetical protein